MVAVSTGLVRQVAAPSKLNRLPADEAMSFQRAVLLHAIVRYVSRTKHSSIPQAKQASSSGVHTSSAEAKKSEELSKEGLMLISIALVRPARLARRNLPSIQRRCPDGGGRVDSLEAGSN